MFGEGRKDAPVIDEVEALGRDVDALRHECIANRHRLSWRGVLQWLLHHRRLDDIEQRLTGDAVEDVHPTGFRGLGERLAYRALVGRIEQNHWIGRVVVPDIVVNLLEMPAILAALRLDGDDRDGK